MIAKIEYMLTSDLLVLFSLIAALIIVGTLCAKYLEIGKVGALA